MGFSQVAARRGHSQAVVLRLLIMVASLTVEHGLQGTQASAVAARGLNSCSSWALEHRLNSRGAGAQFLRGMWDPPGLGVEPVSPILEVDSLLPSHQGSLVTLLKVYFRVYSKNSI